ncbi:hypothetical protein OIU84_018737 [Salix udensis]|uniref:Uncharacterized protein n=1 Tax=Salix udensis TaxID=889485 RepID=A0AAD6PJG1_9ROSI|nr:hypothetical protein OIU84_018737 [Salix udensis]
MLKLVFYVLGYGGVFHGVDRYLCRRKGVCSPYKPSVVAVAPHYGDFIVFTSMCKSESGDHGRRRWVNSSLVGASLSSSSLDLWNWAVYILGLTWALGTLS